ncbi:MAG: glycerol kinase GlpK [Planctomycetes bacterium]|nr:glycerol kinase GlpK [Planctomycetota bacterium]
MKYVLALDQGTTSSRAILFDRDGNVRGVAQREFTQHFPAPGQVEHDADEIWATQIGCVSEVLAKTGAHAGDVVAIGITNQRETSVVWERSTGRPIARAIVWQDRRTADACARLVAAGHETLLRERTGLVADPYFSATKAAWLLDHVAGARARAERGELCFGTIDTWLLWKLSGGACHATEPSNASRTLLFDLRTLAWDDELCALLRVPRAVLPEVRDSSGIVARVADGLPLAGVPIAGIAGDQQAALFGQGCTEAGLAKCTYGTGCFLLANVGASPRVSRHRLLTTVAWRFGSTLRYALEGSVFAGGAVVQWLRDGLGVVARSEDVEALAGSVEDSDGVVFVPAFTGLGAPHWDPHARGTICGITRGTTKANLARAALESIALQVADLVECIDQDLGAPLRELRVDGGASRNDLLMQMQADLIGRPVVRSAITETTAFGAARLAGLAVGFWDDVAGSHERMASRRFLPAADAKRRMGGLRARWREAVERSKGWANAAGVS